MTADILTIGVLGIAFSILAIFALTHSDGKNRSAERGRRSNDDQSER